MDRPALMRARISEEAMSIAGIVTQVTPDCLGDRVVLGRHAATMVHSR
jgi:hypothetical protein